MPNWRATVEKPDGVGGWTTVAVFGTSASDPGSGRYVYGQTAFEAAQGLLLHVWPVNLAKFNQRDDSDKWRDERDANTGIGDHRITVDVDESNRWSHPYEEPLPEPLTVTVAELRLAAIRTEVAALAEARAELRALNKQIREKRSDVRYLGYRVEQAKEEATRAGVAAPEVTKAGRPPRKKRS